MGNGGGDEVTAEYIHFVKWKPTEVTYFNFCFKVHFVVGKMARLEEEKYYVENYCHILKEWRGLDQGGMVTGRVVVSHRLGLG